MKCTMFKRLAALGLCCMVATSVAFAANDAEDLYDDLIHNQEYLRYLNTRDDLIPWTSKPSSYCYFDIDQNGTPELLLQRAEAGFSRLLIFSYDMSNDTPVFAGELYMYGTPSYSAQYHALVCTYPRPNRYYTCQEFYTLENNKTYPLMQVGWSAERSESEYYVSVDNSESDLTQAEYNQYLADITDFGLEFSSLSDYYDTPFPFTDVPSNAPYYDDVQLLYQIGIMSGTSSTTFSPNLSLTRGMLVSLLYRLDGCPPANPGARFFIDVSYTDYYCNAVGWGVENGILAGYGDGYFGPNDVVTREQMATIIFRYCDLKGYGQTDSARDSLLEMSDSNQVSPFAIEGVSWALAERVLLPIHSTIVAPKQAAARSDVSIALAAIYNYTV